MTNKKNMMNYENYDPYFPDQPVVDLYLPIWANLPAFGSKPAFIWSQDGSPNGSTLTYSQLNNSVQSISSNLNLSLAKGDTVVILCSPGLELVEILFGCQRAGLLSVPISPPDPTTDNYHHLIRVVSQTNPKAAIAHHEYISSIHHYISSPNSDPKLVEILKKIKWVSTKSIKSQNFITKFNSSSYNGCYPDDIYLIQYTSGATGIPKPVLVSAGAAAHNVRSARKSYDLHPNSVIISWLPQYHDCGLMFLLLTIVSGATCVLTSPKAFVRRPRVWLELITNFKGSCTPVPSFALPLVVRRGGPDKGTLNLNLRSLENLIIINEPILETSVIEFVDVFSEFGLNPFCISPSYGLAENCTFVSTSWRVNETVSFPSYKKLLPSARLGNETRNDEESDMEILVVNEETHEPVDDGIEGEIWVSSPSNGSGYLDHDSLTREVFYGRLSNSVSRRYVRTGDRGIVKGERRYLYVMGRCSDMVKFSMNQEIHPHYIETIGYNSCTNFLRGGCLAAFNVWRCVVLVAEMQKSNFGIQVLKNISEKIKEAILEETGIEVGLIVLVESGNVPKTTSGKIQRWAARDKLFGGKMNALMETRFGESIRVLPLIRARFHGIEGRGDDESGKEKRVSSLISSL